MSTARLRAALDRLAPRPPAPWPELAAESVAVKIRWFGLAVGALVANFGPFAVHALPLDVILLLGLAFTAADTLFYLRGRLFLRDLPLAIAALEALFIALLCHFEAGPDSPFRFYYLLSLICCAIRYSPLITAATCGLDCLSYGVLFSVHPAAGLPLLASTLVILVWATWAAGALARLLKRTGEELRSLNAALTATAGQLESRIAERTRELEESQAQVLHQEKMAAFGLLAAGIAHEVGNPLAGISGVVQMLERRDPDEYTREKLSLVNGQLARIQGTLRELVAFGRPASDRRGAVGARAVVDEALGIAKYYKGGKARRIAVDVPATLPPLTGVRDQLVQVLLNLLLNAIDATGTGGRIDVTSAMNGGELTLAVADDGAGIAPAALPRLFRPYFTTKPHGTGLGLFVVRRIVDAHGGRVAVESAPGRGTTFRVTLPTVPAACPALTAPPAGATG